MDDGGDGWGGGPQRRLILLRSDWKRLVPGFEVRLEVGQASLEPNQPVSAQDPTEGDSEEPHREQALHGDLPSRNPDSFGRTIRRTRSLPAGFWAIGFDEGG